MLQKALRCRLFRQNMKERKETLRIFPRTGSSFLNGIWRHLRKTGQVPSSESGMWEDVTIPHCWNTWDGADGGNNYHKGIGWYVKEFSAGELSEEQYGGKQVFLEMGAACKISEIYVNGEKIARHEGGIFSDSSRSDRTFEAGTAQIQLQSV